ncbi:nucleoside phosphorylase domain-containing protein [Aspergillus leporis]|jgi:nucleoside phosphorylase|uniref:Nucleoside phosphorylase domain-containing protein n=1 Tax=Aspergillus leporis TaxID=41062 RepID=A0A5N5XIW9_9EURO|nr:nucleoside phosphorylase domain-containing protein [Aspergillus leporis]
MLPSLPDPNEFEICIICASPLEAAAVSVVFDKIYHMGDTNKHVHEQQPIPRNYAAYTMGRIAGHRVVLACLPGLGKVYSAGESRRLKERFKGLKLALLVGICGAIPKSPDGQDIIIGDTIVGHRIIEFDFGKQYPYGFQRAEIAEHNLIKSNAGIRRFASKLEARREQLENRTREILVELANAGAYPGLLSCVELGCDSSLLMSHTRLQNGTSEKTPATHFGAFASGDMIVDAAEDRDEIAEREKVVAFEMTAAGAWVTLPCIIVKGVSDHADGHRNRVWETYAAATAAACAKAILNEWVPSFEQVTVE